MDKMIITKERYFPSGKEDLSWGIRCLSTGEIHVADGAHYSMNRTKGWRSIGAYQLLWLQEGAGRCVFPVGKPIELRAGRCLLLPPHLPHRYGPHVDGWKERWLQFDGSFLLNWVPEVARSDRSFKRDRPDASMERAMVVDLWGEALDQWSEWERRWNFHVVDAGEDPGDLAVLMFQVMNILLKASRRDVLAIDANQDCLAAQAHLRANVCKEVDFEALAEDLGMSYSHLRKKFRSCFGRSMLQYQVSLRMAEARRLLEKGDLKVEEVAQALGYSDPLYFSRQFKKSMGVAPSVWQKLEF